VLAVASAVAAAFTYAEALAELRKTRRGVGGVKVTWPEFAELLDQGPHRGGDLVKIETPAGHSVELRDLQASPMQEAERRYTGDASVAAAYDLGFRAGKIAGLQRAAALIADETKRAQS
jgi:hypothetical protein